MQLKIADFREPVSGFTHLAGAFAAAVGFFYLLMLTHHALDLMVAVAIYGASIIITFIVSAVMHLYTGSKRIIRWLIRLDHAAIYLMIAGSFTPVIYLFVPDEMRSLLLVVIWGMAIGGAIHKLLTWQRDTLASTLYYVLMACVGLLALPAVLPHLSPPVIVLFTISGLTYAGGAAIFALRRPNINRHWGYHEVWHIFSLLGSGFHYIAIILLLM